ncbi:tail fiber domain-containing protein [Sphingomonas sp. KR1UV-12]|uniref:Tail fiber domain-containing protein n=1 Tax=Sphingomonas aurea TaxID=3063994 RepID=A0ABT9EPQ2_9SPHN|nr:tail fiber domain-containing protein [Sphingomonas sp. KR1UV-12]MDP1028801.1 tail fiber domain-containing protein [Sphingomonas sp. KR1UV-12]
MSDELPVSRRTILATASGASLSALSQALPATPMNTRRVLPSASQTSGDGPTASASDEFVQSGEGATRRTIAAKMSDFVSVADYGASADGQAQEQFAFTGAAASLSAGGPLDVTAGMHLVGPQTFGPARGNVHAYDTAVIGNRNLVADGTFATRLASAWHLVGFVRVSGGVKHEGGRPASLLQTIVVEPYASYVAVIDVESSIAGGMAIFLGGRPIFTEGDFSILALGKDTYKFVIFSYDVDGFVDLELRFDNDWSGVVSRINLSKVEREAPYDFFSISHDKRDFSNIFGIKFGRFLSGNIAIGDRLTSGLMSEKAGWNIAIGPRALSTNVDEFENTAIGAFVLEYNQASRNVAGGYSAFRYNTKGERNTGWGYKVFGRNSTGSNNTGVGFWAGLYNQLGNDNSYFGSRAGYYNSNGNYNSFFGSQAGLQNDGGLANTYIGAISGPYATGTQTFHYSHSTCVGAESKGYGSRTTAIGSEARCGSNPYDLGRAIATTATALGHRAVANDDGTAAIGGGASASGAHSTCLGEVSATNGASATALGASAYASETSTAIGAGAGRGLSGKSNISIGVGANSDGVTRSYENAIAIGNGAMCTTSNQLVLGNHATRQIRAATAVITTLSDKRDKANIEYLDTNHASCLLRSLKPARWIWKHRDRSGIEGSDVGFIAQDLLLSQTEAGADWLNLVDDSNANQLHAAPSRLIPILVSALQDALKRIEKLEKNV